MKNFVSVNVKSQSFSSHIFHQTIIHHICVLLTELVIRFHHRKGACQRVIIGRITLRPLLELLSRCPIFVKSLQLIWRSGARSSNELHWHDLKIGYHDNNPSNDCRVACPIKWLKIYPCLAKIMMIQSVLSSNYPLLCIDCFSWSDYLGRASDSINYYIL